LAAFVDMNVFDPNVLVAATAQAPVGLDLGAKGPPILDITAIAAMCVQAIWRANAASISSDGALAEHFERCVRHWGIDSLAMTCQVRNTY